MTKNDKNLIKSALRRAFARSDLHKEIIESTRVNYTDGSRPRVKNWSICPFCGEYTPSYVIQVDHREPVIPYHLTIDDISAQNLIGRIFTAKSNLQAMCQDCHFGKSSAERDLRKQYKKKGAKCKKSKRRTSKRSNA